MTRPTAESPATEAGRALLADWDDRMTTQGAVAERIRAIEAEAAALSDSAHADCEGRREAVALNSRFMNRQANEVARLREALQDVDDFWKSRPNCKSERQVRVGIAVALASQPTQDAEPSLDPICEGYCGTLGWTVERWGRVTHKHSCPRRTDPWCQTHSDGCPDAEPSLDALTPERLAADGHACSVCGAVIKTVWGISIDDVPKMARVIERMREAIEAEWYNGNLDEKARDRLLALTKP